MKLENQVCTPVQSIRLKELGVIQESNYQWNLTTHAEPYLNVPPFGKVDNNGLSYSAFTVAELGVMFGIGTRATDWLVNIMCHPSKTVMWNPYFLAKCLIEALENNLTTAAEVNERLKNA